jgi:hypothetical protein
MTTCSNPLVGVQLKSDLPKNPALSRYATHRAAKRINFKSFLVLFFKKEPLASSCLPASVLWIVRFNPSNSLPHAPLSALSVA